MKEERAIGILDRDYYREATRRSGLVTGLTPVCTYLLIANIAVYVAQMFTAHNALSVTDMLELRPSAVLFHGQVWRLITSGFCHDPRSLWHIAFNMMCLWSFARTLELEDGSKEFCAFYFASLFVSSLTYVFLGWFLQRDNPAVGASGAVVAVVTLFALRYPRAPVYLFVVRIEAFWLIILYLAYDLLPVLWQLQGDPSSDGVAHACHLGGLAYAFLYWHFDLRLKNRSWPNPRRFFRRRPKLRLYDEPPPRSEPRHSPPPPDSASLQAQVDEILTKINRDGIDSLTADERRTLEEASRRYREKQ